MFKNLKISAKSLGNTRVLCASAVLAALFVALYALKLQLTPQLRITFTFIPLAISGWLFGPVPALLVGTVGDIVGAFLFPQGAFFPGFTLTSLLSGFIFGLTLYQTDTKNPAILRIILSKLFVSLFLNCFLNSLWFAILSGNGYIFYLSQHLIKNAILFPVEVLILVIVLKFLSGYGIKKMYK